MIYRFGSFDLDTRLMELRRDDTRVSIEPQAFDVLRLLIENRRLEIFYNFDIGNVMVDYTHYIILLLLSRYHNYDMNLFS